MFIALRRFTLLCTIVLERVMYHKQHDKSTYGAVATMILGAPLCPKPCAATGMGVLGLVAQGLKA